MTESTPNDISRMDLGEGTGGVWAITPHGNFLGKTLAETNLVEGADVLELGAGMANHTILIARQRAASIVATEIHADYLESAKTNFTRNCPEFANIEFRVADWLSVDGDYDVIITNPPFAKSGKQNRRYYIDSLILDGHKRLRLGGRLVFIQSSMADLAETKQRLNRNGYDFELVGTTRNPFRDYYFEDQTFMDEIQKVENGFEIVDGTHFETLYVIHATLRSWSPPESAHLPPDKES